MENNFARGAKSIIWGNVVGSGGGGGALNWASPSKVYVPVRADGLWVKDNGGDVVCQCFTPELARVVAELLNAHAGL